MPTPNFGLPLYGPTDTAKLDTLLNGQSTAIDAALLEVQTRLIGTAAQRDAFPSPREGLAWYNTDTGTEDVYRNGAWLPATGSWITTSPENGYWSVDSQYGYRGLAVRATDASVFIEGVIRNNTQDLVSETNYTGARVPAGHKPSTRAPIVVTNRADLRIEASVQPSGEVRFFPLNTVPRGTLLIITGQWERVR